MNANNILVWLQFLKANNPLFSDIKINYKLIQDLKDQPDILSISQFIEEEGLNEEEKRKYEEQ